MLKALTVFISLSVVTFASSAEVYKCVDNNTVRYSTTPCDEHLIDLEVHDEQNKQRMYGEYFQSPEYPGWKGGWKVIKSLKLARFEEIDYVPTRPQNSPYGVFINQQKLSDLPQSMTVQRFAISVEDIIESICANANISTPRINNSSESVFYGQYACSVRRDTKKGELGIYKIVRGQTSIYMMMIKWSVEPFTIKDNLSIEQYAPADFSKRLKMAKRYLKEQVKLCDEGSCE